MAQTRTWLPPSNVREALRPAGARRYPRHARHRVRRPEQSIRASHLAVARTGATGLAGTRVEYQRPPRGGPPSPDD
eukprot:10360640-Prorocentrum_lima.AAC.1